jgi:hypothetical protein
LKIFLQRIAEIIGPKIAVKIIKKPTALMQIIISTFRRIVSEFGMLGSLELFAAFLVAIGCGGELWILLNKLTRHIDPLPKTAGPFWRLLARLDTSIRPIAVRLKVKGRKLSEAKEQLLERIFVMLVAFGVGMEFICLMFSLHEVATLNAKASQAYERASNAESNTAVALGKVEELRKQNDELEAKQIRAITLQQKDNFIKILRNDPKCSIKVFLGSEQPEATNYANDVVELLKEAGYEVDDTNGIKQFRYYFKYGIGDRSREAPISFLFFGNRTNGIDWPFFKARFNPAAGHCDYVFWTNDCSGAPGMIMDAFKQIGIMGSAECDENMFFLKPGEWAIFIPPRF